MGKSRNLSSSDLNSPSCLRTFSNTFSFLNTSRLASAAAQATGWPPNVVPFRNSLSSSKKGSNKKSLAIIAPMGMKPLVIPLAQIIMSGI